MTLRLQQAWESIQAFLEAGGSVLTAIFVVTLLMWTLILERALYALLWHRQRRARAILAWQRREDHASWNAEQIRRSLVSDVAMALESGIPMVKALVAVCPLLGLLGTVSGMIEVFDVMAVSGSGNPRAMAAGVSRATIPTMAGMVAAISGLVFSVQLDRFAAAERTRVDAALPGGGGG